jgi:hypothetical protein
MEGILMARKKGNNYIIDEENKIVKIELRRRKKKIYGQLLILTILIEL